MKESTSYDVIADHLPQKLRSLVLGVKERCSDDLMEIRLRVNGPVFYVFPDRIMFLSTGGGLSAAFGSNSVIADKTDITECIDKLCRYSLHSCTRQLSEGYFVIGHGVRVGVSGSYSATEPSVLTDFCSLNFRLSRQLFGCAEQLFSETYDRNVIICGGVNSGKTTLLRELCRLNGNICKTALIDERNEISCFADGGAQNDVGAMTDIISNCSRSCGIVCAVRTLSPDVIFCDEIASQADADAVISGLSCGVRFIVTAHGENEKELLKRAELRSMIESGFFHCLVFLKGASAPGITDRIVGL